jgi:hypothetical protein
MGECVARARDGTRSCLNKYRCPRQGNRRSAEGAGKRKGAFGNSGAAGVGVGLVEDQGVGTKLVQAKRRAEVGRREGGPLGKIPVGSVDTEEPTCLGGVAEQGVHLARGPTRATDSHADGAAIEDHFAGGIVAGQSGCYSGQQHSLINRGIAVVGVGAGEEQRADTGLGEAGRAAAVADDAAELAYTSPCIRIVGRITDQDRPRGAVEIDPVRKVEREVANGAMNEDVRLEIRTAPDQFSATIKLEAGGPT